MCTYTNLKILNFNLQASVRVRVAKEFHRFILGKGGKTLSRIEAETGTKITLPKANDTESDTKITGSKDGLHKAAKMIQAIVDEHSKTDRRVLDIPQPFHSLLAGPNNQTLNAIIDRNGGPGHVKVHVPPKVGNVDKPDEIAVAGDRESVHKVADELMKLYEMKKKTCKTLNLTIAKPKHKYIIGPQGSAIQEIFACTGVSIKVPPTESDSDQVTLFGEGDKIGNAVSLVLQKADSSNRVEIAAPGWLQRYVKDSVDKFKVEFPKLHIELNSSTDQIVIEGSTPEVDKVQKELEPIVHNLLRRCKQVEIKVDPKHYRHLIGRDGKSIQQLRKDTGVNINFPENGDGKSKADGKANPVDVIRIDGEISQVDIAKKRLMEEVSRIENEKSKEVTIEKRYHRFLVAKRAEFMKPFPDVYISFPRQEENSDVVEIRGPKSDVEKASKLLQKMYEEVKASKYEAPVLVMKQFHKRIIGKQGANVARIRVQTDVEIDLPPPNSDSQRIVVRGRKENVEKAIAMIEEMQRTFENTVEVFVEIPHKFHDDLIGPRGAGVQAIQQECENVIIRFPNDKDGASDKILVFGPKEEVEVARKMLIERANDVKETSYSEELRIKPEYHRYLIGRKGAKVRQLHKDTKARVVFPDSGLTGEDAEVVVIIGREADVKKARKIIDDEVKHLEETKEETIVVDPAYHKHFVSRKGMVVNTIASECGGVSISFPRQGSDSHTVTIKGPKDCVSEAARRMMEEVDKLKREVTIEVLIAAKHRRSFLGKDGEKVNNIMKEFDVNITFPPSAGRSQNGRGRKIGSKAVDDYDGDQQASRGTSSPDDSSLTTNEGQDNDSANATAEHSPVAADPENEPMMTVTITGLDNGCESAKAALLDLIPVSEEITIASEHHSSLIGKKGAEIRKIMEQYDVHVSFPAPKENLDVVTVTGAQAAVDAAVAALKERVNGLEQEKEDRILRSFKMTVNVNPLLQRKFMSRNWAEANRIMKKYDVNLTFPRKGQAEDEVVITGYEAKCLEAKEEIERVAGPIESQFVLDIPIDRRLIPRLMGTKGRNLHELMDEFKCEIIVPSNNEGDIANIQLVGPEDNIYLCRNHIEVMQEDALLDLPPLKKTLTDSLEGEENANGRRGGIKFQLPNGDSPKGKGKKSGGPGYVLKDAPWSAGSGKNAPDLGSSHEFPAFASNQGLQNGDGNNMEQQLPIGHNPNGVIGSPQQQVPTLSWGPTRP